MLVAIGMVQVCGEVASLLLLWRMLRWLVPLGLCVPSLLVGAGWLRVLCVAGAAVVRGVHGDVAFAGTPVEWAIVARSSVLVCISDCLSN